MEIRLSQENAAFPDYMSVGILPAHLLEGEDLATCAFNREPVGAGPYCLTAWDRGQSITMERFEDYYGGTPNIKTVVFKIVPDSDARALQLMTGENAALDCDCGRSGREEGAVSLSHGNG